MPGPQGSSFIPKQPARGKVRGRVRKIYVLAYISYVVFFGTLIATGGTFFYKISVDAQLQNQKQQLIEQRDTFSEADTERIKELDMQLRSAKDLLDNHISGTSLFYALEQSTVESVTLGQFSLLRTPSFGLELTLSGITNDFNSLLFQRSILATNPILYNAEFTSISGENNNKTDNDISRYISDPDTIEVSFAMIKELSPSEIPYQPRVDDLIILNQDQNEELEENNDPVSDEVTNDQQL